MDSEVLIAGAGPVGLWLAVSLLRLGLGVRIIDKAAARSDKSKALVIWPRTLEALAIDGCIAPFLAEGLQVADARIVSGAHTVARLSFDIANSAFPYGLFIPQSDTERLLEAELERRGGRVEREVELTAFTQDTTGVTAQLRHADGGVETTRAAWLIGCDGAHSTVRHTLDLPFTGVTMPSTWMLADIMLDGPVEQEVLISWCPHGVLAIFPIGPKRFRVIADMDSSDDDAAAPTMTEVQRILDIRGPGGLTARDPIWLNRFRINERKVADYRSGRVFVVGDAAHIHSPAGGQGMNTGMQDAANLAWKLALVCRGAAGDRLLDSVSPERSAIGEQVLRNAGRLTRLAILRNPVLQWLRNRAVAVLSQMPPVRRRLVDAMTELDLHYPDSPLNGPALRGAPCQPGDRATDLVFAGENGVRASIAERLRSGRFLILGVMGEGPKLPELTLSAPEAVLAALAVTRTASDQYRPGFFYVIRPDGYIAMVAAEPGPVARYLGTLTP